MEIRKPGAAELKPALALAWDVFLKDAASCFSDEGIRTFKRFIEYDSMAATLANGTTTMWAAFSGLEPIGVIEVSAPQGKAISACSSSPALIKGME